MFSVSNTSSSAMSPATRVKLKGCFGLVVRRMRRSEKRRGMSSSEIAVNDQTARGWMWLVGVAALAASDCLESATRGGSRRISHSRSRYRESIRFRNLQSYSDISGVAPSNVESQATLSLAHDDPKAMASSPQLRQQHLASVSQNSPSHENLQQRSHPITTMFGALNRFIAKLDAAPEEEQSRTQGAFGFQVLRNTNPDVALEPWFDFVIGINGRTIVG
jgi:hypothetical protein